MIIYPASFFGFEAAVCGGIPVINSLQRDFVADGISSLSGIMNGTTNYILSKMETEGVEFGPTLKEAQDLGYAEADPAADIEGWDAYAKLRILTRMIYGPVQDKRNLSWEQALAQHCEGITKISKIDFEYAKMMSCTIKLLGQCKKEGDSVVCFVSPFLVDRESSVAACRGPTNLVSVRSDNLYETVFVGPGAGRYPTANSVMNDIVAAALKDDGQKIIGNSNNPFRCEQKLDSQSVLNNDFRGEFYIRLHIKDGLGIMRNIGEEAEKAGVSINSMMQNKILDRDDVYTAIRTEECTKSQVNAFAENISKYSWCWEKPTAYPFL